MSMPKRHDPPDFSQFRSRIKDPDALVAALDRLLTLLSPYRGSSHEVVQVMQELKFLQSSINLDVEPPANWEQRLLRVLRDSEILAVPGLQHVASDIMRLLPSNVVPIERPKQPPAALQQPLYRFRLFICGTGSRTNAALANFKKIQAALGHCELEIVDILLQPEAAESERILATPTLVRDYPLPPRKIIGDLSDINTVLIVMGV